MSNDYYNASSLLTRFSQAKTPAVNTIFEAIAAAFDKLPTKAALFQNAAAFATDTGAADVYAVTLSEITAYAEGMKVRVKIANTNTGASTLNVSGLGAITIKRQDGSNVSATDLTAGDIHDFVYDGTNFVMTSPSRTHMAGIANNLAADLIFSGEPNFTDKVGIRQADPTYPLDVNGEARVDTVMRVEGTAPSFRLKDTNGTLDFNTVEMLHNENEITWRLLTDDTFVQTVMRCTVDASGATKWEMFLGSSPTRLVLDSSGLSLGAGLLTLDGNITGGRSITVADDAVGTWTVPRNGCHVKITANGAANFPLSAHSAYVWIDAGSSLFIQENSGFANVGNTLSTSTSNVTGTTGVDGETTVAVQAGQLKIENRSGTSITYSVTFS